jgi:hypothetical protein
VKLRVLLQSLCAVAALVAWSRADGPVYWDPAIGGNGHYYQLVSGYLAPPFVRNSGKSWSDAAWDARNAPAPADAPYGHLLTIGEQAELHFIMATFGDALPAAGYNEGAWIGFTDAAVAGRWQWSDGQGGVWENPAVFSSPRQDAVAPWTKGQPTNLPPYHVSLLNRDANLYSHHSSHLSGQHLVEWEPEPAEGTRLIYTAPIAGRGGNQEYAQLLTGLPTTPTSRGVLSVRWEQGSDNRLYLDDVLLLHSTRDDPVVVSIDANTLAEMLADGQALFRLNSGTSVTVVEASLTFEYSYEPRPVEPWQPVPILDTQINAETHNTYHLLAASSWADAQRTARELGGHLVTINDAGEENWVWTTFNSGGQKLLWNGLNDADRDGAFTWVSGEPVEYVNWRADQPSGNEYFVQMGHWESPYPRTWNDLADDNIGFEGKVFGVVEVYSGPRVAGVEVGGLTWVGGGHDMPLGNEDQLLPLPWTRVNQVRVEFSEHVTIDGQAATLIDGEGNEYALFGPTLVPGSEPGTVRASWQLEEFLDTGRYTLRLDDGILDDDGLALDGDWIDGESVASGNGAAGGDFVFSFNILAGDANQDGLVNVVDMIEIRNRMGMLVGADGYSQFHDIDTRGSITLADVYAAGVRAFDVLPPLPAENAAAVPEPSTWVLLGIGLSTALCGSLVRSRFGKHSVDRGSRKLHSARYSGHSAALRL